MGKKQLIRVLLSFFLILSIITPLIPADEFYADINISIDDSGYVSIKGKTNYPGIIVENSQEFTYKNKSIWTLNITINETFSDFIYLIELPEKSEIISLYSTGSTRIKDESGKLIIEGFGSKQFFSIEIKYQKEKEVGLQVLSNLDSLSIMLILIIVILIILFIIVLFTEDKKNRFKKPLNKLDFDEKKLKGLNTRQKNILHLLMDSEVTLTQTDIQKELNMPKASVSRNIRRLELKGLIEKEKIGMSNLIRIKKS